MLESTITMARGIKLFVNLVCLVVITLLVGTAGAQDRIARQIGLLQNSEDFRVRTQAALSLGSSRSDRAVAPLCRALDDGNTTVRIASAAALGKLQLGGAECLETRLAREPSASVKATIDRALAKLKIEAEPAIGKNTKLYIAVGKLVHQTGRGSVEGLLRSSMLKMAVSLGDVAVAPSGETPARARALLQKHGGLKAFYLAPTLKVIYGGGRLTIKLDIAMLTYPEKNVIGSFAKTAASPGVSEGDTAAEDELVAYAAESAMKQFAKLAPSL